MKLKKNKKPKKIGEAILTNKNKYWCGLSTTPLKQLNVFWGDFV